MNITLLQQQLETFNLSSEEAAVYTTILKLGEATVAQLAQAANLKRPATYNYVESLIIKGLLDWKKGSRGKIVEPQDPSNLVGYLNSVKDSYQTLQNTYKQIIPELNSLKVRHNFSAQVKYYEKVKGVQQMIFNSLNAQGVIYGYSSYGRNTVLGLEFMKEYRKKWLKAQLLNKVIVNDSETLRKFSKQVMVESYLRHLEVRVLPKEELYISSDILIYNNVYAVANLDPRDMMGVEIINEEIAKTQLSIFNLLWKMATPAAWK